MGDSVKMSGPCNRAAHDACRSASVCGCDCHVEAMTPAERKLAGRPPIAAVPTSTDAAEPDGIEWGAPPVPRSGRRTVGPDVIEALRARPGEWAKVRTFDAVSAATSAAKKVARGANPDLPAAEWEAAGRKVGKGSCLWLRYTGAAGE